MSDRFTFFASFREAAKGMPDDMRLRFYDAISEYGIDETEPELDGMLAAVFALVKPVIDSGSTRRENGKKGGRPKKANEDIKETKGFQDKNHRFSKSKPDMDQEQDKEVDKDKDPEGDSKGVRERTGIDLFAELTESASLHPTVEEAAREWIAYKKERRFSYKATGMKSLINQMRKATADHGPEAVAKCIRDSIANGYQGIIWDRIKADGPKKQSGQFYQFQQGEYDYAEIERRLREN